MTALKSIPPELWAQIFHKTLPVVPSSYPFDSPALLTQICHEWRALALRTPTLWSSISLPYVFVHGSLTNGAVHLCQLWLDRAHAAPLTIDLRLPDEDIGNGLEIHQLKVLEEVLALVFSDSSEAAAQTRSRLRTVRLHAFPQSLLSVLRLDSLPALIELKISHTRKDTQHKPAKFTRLPRTLRTLTLTDTSIDLRAIPLASWPRKLKHLELWQTNDAGLSAERCLTILEGLPELESLGVKLIAAVRGKGRHRHATSAKALSGVDEEVGPSLKSLSNAHGRISLKHLKRLHIASPPGQRTSLGLDQLLAVIHTPALQVLAFDGCVLAALDVSDAEAEGASVGIAGEGPDAQYDVDVAFWAAFERLVRETRATLQVVAFGRLETIDCEFFEMIERGRAGVMFRDADKDSVVAKEHAELAKAKEFLPIGPTCNRLDVYVCQSSFDEHMCGRPEDDDLNAPTDEEEAEYAYLPCLTVLAPRLWRDLHPDPRREEDVVEEGKSFTTISICKGSSAGHGGFVLGKQSVDSILKQLAIEG